jgi:predicted nucleic acid-binding Zn ribbon protein
MLNLKPRLDLNEHPAKLLRRKRCTVCRKPFTGHFASRQCSDPCRAEAVRARGRVSSQKIRDARWESLPDIPCLWCRKPMERKRSTRKTCSDRCRKALSRFDRERRRQRRKWRARLLK